jgi:uncharacterized protein (TIRG00374 family)
MANNLFPARGGDLLRCLLMTREHKLNGASLALATLGLEKVFDGMTLLLVILFTVVFAGSPDWLARMGLFSCLFFGGSVAVLLLLHFRSVWLIEAIRSLFRAVRLVALGERMVTLLASFVEGLTVMSSPFRLVGLILATIVIWLGEAAVISALGLTLNIGISFPAAILVSAVLGLGLAVPAGPGFVGTFEFFAVAGLSLTGVEAETALALALVMHAWSFLATSSFGLVGIATARLSRTDRLSLFPVTAGGIAAGEK